MMPTAAPLLNEYKYQLLLTRLVQTITGGVKIRKQLPHYAHVLQWLLWLLPFFLSLPFLGVSFVWNGYYLGAIYGVLITLLFLLVNIAIKLINYKTVGYRNHDNFLSQLEDEGNVITCSDVIQYISVSRSIPIIALHSLVSGLAASASFILLDIPALLKVLHVAGVVIFYTIGWLTTSVSLYSIMIHPPLELSAYRSAHEDRLGLRFIHRPLYVILTGIILILLRETFTLSSVYLYVLYCFYCLLPLLWILGVLPSLDALLFWFLEQSLVHLMGGTLTASELRLVFLFLISLIATVTVALISSHNQMTASVMASGLGFLLSLNLLQLLVDIARSFTVWRRFKDVCQTLHYTSYCCLKSNQVQSLRHICLKYVTSLLRNTTLLLFSILLVYFTASRQASSTVLIVVHALMIVLGTFEVSFKVASELYCCGIRNPFHPRRKDSLSYFKSRRRLLFFLSFPRQLLLLYIYPLCMVTYTGLNIQTINISTVWFGIAVLRLLRKVWQNTASAVRELLVVALLNLVLSSDNIWISRLDIGTQSLIVGYGLTLCSNIYSNVCFYFILVIGFVGDAKLRTRNHTRCLLLVILLSPVSILSILLSSLLSAPLIPLFTLPLLLTVSPRPSFYWPRLTHKSFTSSSTDAVFYKQAEREIIKSLSITHPSMAAGESLLVRYQDRTILVLIHEKGYAYCTISLQGLELQETSCHSVEVTKMDEIIDSAYTTSHTLLSYWYNSFPCHVLKPTDAYIATVYSDARNNLSGIIDQPLSLAKFSSNLYKTILYIIMQYALSVTGVLPDAILRTNDTVDESLSCSSSLSSMDITSLQRKVFSPTISPQSIRASDVKLHGLTSPWSGSNRVTPLSTTNTLPSSIPMTNRYIAVSLEGLSQSWYNHLLHRFNLVQHFTSTQLTNLKILSAVPFAIIDTPTNSKLPTRPSHLYRGFQGNFIVPLNTQTDLKWLQDNSVLFDLVLKAHRYAVKLLYDEVALGEALTEDELCEYLNEYDRDWFIGGEDNHKWKQAILDEKLHLFSMDYRQDENSYTAHILSLQDEIINFVQINPWALRGVWSNLSWELQYLTNDDEERYSIQAHSRLLRNIFTQTAEIPLGYHIYQSPLIVLSHV